MERSRRVSLEALESRYSRRSLVGAVLMLPDVAINHGWLDALAGILADGREAVPITGRRLRFLVEEEIQGRVEGSENQVVRFMESDAIKKARNSFRLQSFELYKKIGTGLRKEAENRVIELTYDQAFLRGDEKWKGVFGCSEQDIVGDDITVGGGWKCMTEETKRKILRNMEDNLLPYGCEGAVDDVHEHNRKRFGEAFEVLNSLRAQEVEAL